MVSFVCSVVIWLMGMYFLGFGLLVVFWKVVLMVVIRVGLLLFLGKEVVVIKVVWVFCRD